ncbi:MAG TPA: methyltransferase domain-containing protein [Usitatibacter sp.]|nr:methyltransferase domain-containing protein [Usitatibacter sp.]
MLDEHWGYVSDPVRLERFERAIRAVVKPGALVADLACGTGVLGLLCLKAGADHVYAIDHGPMLEVARETVARNGLAERVTLIAGRSEGATLPRAVDVLICDNVGWFGFDYDILSMLGDARRRFLKPGGGVLPRRLGLQIAPVSSERCRALAGRWAAHGVPAEFHWLQEWDTNTKHPIELAREDLTGDPANLASLDLCREQPSFASWRVALEAGAAGPLDGLGGWFECELAPGVSMTNSPLADERIQRQQVFLPIAERVDLNAGDPIEVTVMARPAEHLIAWSVSLPRMGRRFDHSTWHGMPLSPQALVRARPDRAPQPSAAGRARGLVLSYCDGSRTRSEIEAAVLREHPTLLPSPEEISRFVVDVIARDTQ